MIWTIWTFFTSSRKFRSRSLMSSTCRVAEIFRSKTLKQVTRHQKVSIFSSWSRNVSNPRTLRTKCLSRDRASSSWRSLSVSRYIRSVVAPFRVSYLMEFPRIEWTIISVVLWGRKSRRRWRNTSQITWNQFEWGNWTSWSKKESSGSLYDDKCTYSLVSTIHDTRILIEFFPSLLELQITLMKMDKVFFQHYPKSLEFRRHPDWQRHCMDLIFFFDIIRVIRYLWWYSYYESGHICLVMWWSCIDLCLWVFLGIVTTRYAYPSHSLIQTIPDRDFATFPPKIDWMTLFTIISYPVVRRCCRGPLYWRMM